MKLIYTFREVVSIASVITFRRAFHLFSGYFSYWLSSLLKLPVVWGLPFSCSIEPTTRCNLKCPECPTGMGILKRKSGDLTPDEFRRRISSLSAHTGYLTLYLQGEPLLNSALPEMIHFATDLNMYTCISTNGHFLNKNAAKSLVGAGLKKIIISLDGTNQQSYSIYRRNGNFNRVLEGIRAIVEARKSAKTKNPLIVIQFIVFGSNDGEIEDIHRLGKSLGVDKVEIKTAQHYDLTSGNKLITSNDKYRRYKQKPDGSWELKTFAKGCARLWTTSVITWDGRIVACCYDKDASFTFGNMSEADFKSVWKSEDFKKFRGKVLSNKKSIEMCCNCGEN